VESGENKSKSEKCVACQINFLAFFTKKSLAFLFLTQHKGDMLTMTIKNSGTECKRCLKRGIQPSGKRCLASTKLYFPTNITWRNVGESNYTDGHNTSTCIPEENVCSKVKKIYA
jgi:hypothetical protein